MTNYTGRGQSEIGGGERLRSAASCSRTLAKIAAGRSTCTSHLAETQQVNVELAQQQKGVTLTFERRGQKKHLHRSKWPLKFFRPVP